MRTWADQRPNDSIAGNVPASSARALELWGIFVLCTLFGHAGGKALYEAFGSAVCALDRAERWGEAGVSAKTVRAFREGSWVQGACDKWNAFAARPCPFLFFSDTSYPERLRRLPDAPLVLFYEGNPALLDLPALAIVGSRRGSREARSICRRLALSLSEEGVIVVSGLAAGIDAEAHRGALQGKGSTIAVMGTGLDTTYPPENMSLRQEIAKQGLLVTEYLPAVPPAGYHFPMRNRIIAGLSLGVIVAEASEKSGSLITARLARELGRPVYVVPNRYRASASAGCADLLRAGACPVLDAADIISELSRASDRPEERPGQPSSPSTSAALPDRIMEALRRNGPTHLDEIGALVGEPPDKISSAVLILEVEGGISRLSGMTYEVRE